MQLQLLLLWWAAKSAQTKLPGDVFCVSACACQRARLCRQGAAARAPAQRGHDDSCRPALPAGWGARMKATALHRALGVLIQYLTVELNNLSCALKQTGAPGPCRTDRPYFAGSDAVVLQLRQLELVPHGEAAGVWCWASATRKVWGG